jgi:hypothetical protein
MWNRVIFYRLFLLVLIVLTSTNCDNRRTLSFASKNKSSIVPPPSPKEAVDNQPATLSLVSDQISNEDLALKNLDITLTDPEGALSCSAMSGTSSDISLLSDAKITFTGTAPNCKISLVPTINKSGRTVVTIKVIDGLFSVETSFNLTVNALSGGHLNLSALGRQAQRKSFFDAASVKFWGFHFNGSSIAYGSSSDGTNWTETGTLSYATGDFSVTSRGGDSVRCRITSREYFSTPC